MAHGLIWLPLLILFFWLAGAGWNEYQKLEAYRTWAKEFDRAKYDIYAVLGQKGQEITWGKPTRKAPINLQTFSLEQVKAIRLMVNNQPSDLENPPEKGRQIALEFEMPSPDATIRIPFTEVALAAQWGKHLQQDWQRSQSLQA
jgi:hypothetical protein